VPVIPQKDLRNNVADVLRREFRTFAYPPPAMLAVREQHGLRPTFAHHGLPWHVAGLER
jgi:hypothetical protein